MKRPSVNLIAAIGLASLTSFLIGWKLAPESSHAPVGGDEAGKEIRTTPRVRPSRLNSSVSRKMDRIRNGATQVERTRAAISLAMALSPSEFVAWLEGGRFSSRSGPELNIFRMIIFERWIKEDPDGLIAWGINNDYGQVASALKKIAEHDPERMIAHFREHPNEALELRQLNEMAGNHPSLALARLKELCEGGISLQWDYYSHYSRELLLAISKGSTAELEAALVSLPDLMKKQAESVIIGRKLERDFDGEIGKLMEHPDGLRILRENIGLLKGKGGALVAAVSDMPASWREEIASSPYDYFQNGEGKEWFAADLEAEGFSVEQAEEIRRKALSSLSYQDPVFVLNNLPGGKIDRYSMDYRVLLVKTISLWRLKSGGSDEGLERILSGITSPDIREAARVQWEAERLQNELKGAKPSDWLRHIGGLEPSSSSMNRTASRLSNLDGAQLAEFREGFRALSGDVKSNAAVAIAIQEVRFSQATELTGDAILYLAQNPPAQDPKYDKFEITRAASQYTLNLAENDPVAAAGWVRSLPEGPARQWAAKNLAVKWNQNDPGAVADWMKSLPASERELVKSHLETSR